MTGGSRGLDWIDVLIHAGVTFCVATLAAGISHQAGFEIELPLVFAVIAVSLVLLGWRRQRARGDTTADDLPRLAELEQRVAELESGRDHVLELEERLDFAERLLAQQRAAERLPQP